MSGETVTWEGSEALRPLLVPIDSIEIHDRNPWRGNVDEIEKSLSRWGQTLPILTDGKKIIAGNHTYLAVRARGWTHVAAIVNDFASEEEARAYLLADNRTAELGTIDRDQLRVLLEEMEASGQWEGTGYREADLDLIRELDSLDAGAAELAALANELPEPPPFEPIELRDAVLLFSGDDYERFKSLVRAYRERYETEGIVGTILAAVAAFARQLNLGAPADAPVPGEGK